nr:hypothetical protein SHINE37_42814 [Rhizobiaceae bacterium]
MADTERLPGSSTLPLCGLCSRRALSLQEATKWCLIILCVWHFDGNRDGLSQPGRDLAALETKHAGPEAPHVARSGGRTTSALRR